MIGVLITVVAVACGGDDNDAVSDANSSASSAASGAADAFSSAVATAATSAAAALASEAASVTSSAPADTQPAVGTPPGERPADNTVRVLVAGKEPKVYAPQNCSKLPGLDGFSFAGQADGGGQLVINALSGSSGNITILGGEVGAGNANFEDMVTNADGTFYGSAKFIDTAVTFYGHCDALKK